MRKLSESIWNDIRRQSAGTHKRVEDNVDNLDLYGFCDYLKKHYNCHKDDDIHIVYIMTKEPNTNNTPLLDVRLFECLGSMYYLYYDGSNAAIYNSTIDILNCRNTLRRTFTTIKDKKSTCIDPKDFDKSTTNTFFMEILDFFLDQVSNANFKPFITKRT